MRADEIYAYPSPAKGRYAWFIYQLESPGEVEISLWNVLGEKVGTLNANHASGGTQRQTWDIQSVAPGVYIYQAVVRFNDGQTRTLNRGKMVVVKTEGSKP